MKPFICCLLFVLSAKYNANAQLFFNEVMASNDGFLADNKDEYEDWIEIYNGGEEAVNLSGYYISDEKYNKKKHQLPPNNSSLNIPPKGYLVLFASQDVTKGPKHLNFSLSNDGEKLYLLSPDGKKTIDNIKYKYQKTNISCGRKIDGQGTWRYFAKGTPGASNNETPSYKGFTSAPKIKKNSGYYDKEFDLKIKHWRRKAKIIYSIDASTPHPDNINGVKFNYKNTYQERTSDPGNTPLLSSEIKSFEYESAVKIQNPKGKKNRVSQFSSTISRSPNYIPNFDIAKGQVIRAVAVRPGRLPSEPKTHTYFFSDNKKSRYSFPVTSVNLNENDLFDFKNGIYTAGEGFDQYRSTNFTEPGLCTPGNYSKRGKQHEKIANVELFQNSKIVLNQKLNLRINGGCTRSSPYKSLRLNSNDSFGNFDFFNKKTNGIKNSVVIRNNGNDYNKTMFKDIFITQWVKSFNFPIQEYQPTILFLNGEYWGVHEYRERIDENYIYDKYGVDRDNIDLVKIVFYGPEEIGNGDDIEYKKLKKFFNDNNFVDNPKYEEAKKLMDIENFIDYQIAHIYVGNIDWPQNNARLWRYKTENKGISLKKAADGKWRWLFYDAERGLGEQLNYEFNDLQKAIEQPTNIILKKLLQNKTFKTQFITRFNDLINSTFKPEPSLVLYDKIMNEMAPEIPEHIQRWKNIPNINTWKSNCDYVKEYITRRPPEVRKHLNLVFGTGSSFNLSVFKPDTAMGTLEVFADSVVSTKTSVDSKNIELSFFQDQIVNLKPKPKAGYKFTHWKSGKNIYFENELAVRIISDSTFSAVFEPIDLSINSTNEVKSDSIEVNPVQITRGISPNNDQQNENILLVLPTNEQLEFFELYDSKGIYVDLEESNNNEKLRTVYTYKPMANLNSGTYYYVYKLKNKSKIVTNYITVSK